MPFYILFGRGGKGEGMPILLQRLPLAPRNRLEAVRPFATVPA